jgi:hypothetical protein
MDTKKLKILRQQWKESGGDLPPELSGLLPEVRAAFQGDDEAKFEEALSLQDQRDMVRHAFLQHYQGGIDGMTPEMEYWDLDIYPDMVTCKKGGKTYRAAYELADGEVTFQGELEQVEVEFRPVVAAQEALVPYGSSEVFHEAAPEAAATPGGVAKAVDDTGWIWDVIVIRQGKTRERTMPNGVRYVRDYTAKALEAAVPKYEGTTVFAFSGQEHADSPAFKGPRDAVGFLKEARFSAGAIRAQMHIYKDADWLRQRLSGLKESGDLSRTGLSHDTSGKGKWLKEGDLAVQRVEEITDVHGVEYVTSPAAGGRITRLVASHNTEDTMGKQDILALVESERPALLANLDPEKITDAQARELLREAMKPEKVATPPEEGTRTTANTEDLKESVLAEFRDELKRRDCRDLLRESLAESKLPKKVQDKIKKQFAGKIFEESELEEAITDMRDLTVSFREAMPQSYGAEVEISQDERDKKVLALRGIFWSGPNDRNHQNFPESLKGVTPYRSIKQAYRDFTGNYRATDRLIFAECAVGPAPSELREDPSMFESWHASRMASMGLKESEHMRESLQTSSFNVVLADEVTRRMIAEYALPNRQTWRNIVSDISSVPDFRTNRRLRIGGYGTLSTVAETGTYPELTSPTDEAETYAVSKKGGLEDLTFEMIKNDDLGAIRRIPVKMGRAAIETLYRGVFDLLEDNGTLVSDGVALISTATHANLISGVLANDTLSEGRQKMMDQTAYNNTAEVLGDVNMPRWLVVPNELEEESWQITRPWSMGQGEFDAADVRNANFHASYGLEPLLVPYFAVATDYWLVADPANMPTIEVGFLDGRQEPETFVQDQPNVGSVFTADKVTYKIRHIWGVCVLDYRGFAGYIA